MRRIVRPAIISVVFNPAVSAALVCLLCMTACEPEARKARATDHIRMLDESVIGYNKQIVRTERDEIDDYILRHHWKMISTPTGLRYFIYGQGKGPRIVKGSEVRLNYRVLLLNGEEVYNSSRNGIKVIYPGTSESETGLQEALLLMKYGDRARLIVPAHLAWGLLGDLNKIPAGASLVYDIGIGDQDAHER